MSNSPPPPTPPTPPTPSIGPDGAQSSSSAPSSPTPSASQAGRVLATTGQLTSALEDVGLPIEESTLESLLLAADRRGYLEWTALTRSGEYVWDLTDAPDRLADAIASALLGWLGDRLGIAEELERVGN